MAWVYFLKTKDEASLAIEHFVNLIQCQFQTTILCFKTDNGGEYVNNRTEAFWTQTGIRHEPIPPYSHESNGIPERFNRTIQTMMRAMLLNLDLRLWAEACSTAIYLRNRLPHSFLDGITPFEGLYQCKPEIEHLRTFGASCYVHIPKEKRPSGSKLHPRAELAIFVGYTTTPTIYKIQTTNKHIHTVPAKECYFTTAEEPSINNDSQLIPPVTLDMEITTSTSNSAN